MARERTLFSSNPYPQLFYRALLVALLGHGLVLVAMAFYASGPFFLQSDRPVVETSVSLVLAAPPNRVVSSQASDPPRPVAKALAEPPSKPVVPAESPTPVKSPTRLEPIQPVDTTPPRETAETPQLSRQSLGSVIQAPQAPISSLSPATASSLGQSSTLPQARIRASAQCVAPNYPRRSIINNEQGVSQLELLIGEDGRVRESRIAKSSGFFRLDQAALQALSACEFEPERVNGEARQAWARIRYVWRLD
ncbi:MAG: energy transducer TonB [Burkholderiaceae bacterium]|jgi:protein TonB